jgi:CheY-like chemotaxis protein
MAESERVPFQGRVLVADDVPTNRVILVRLLKGLGFECAIAENGKEAFERWLSEDPRVIFMDLQMPVLDGLEAARLILERARQEERTPPLVVAVTANVFEEHREQCRKVGMDGFLSKPLSRAHLKEVLEPLLRRAA